jgi:hypothetical protein
MQARSYNISYCSKKKWKIFKNISTEKLRGFGKVWMENKSSSQGDIELSEETKSMNEK